ncbi:alpha/beta hydrolase [Microvirga sp. TS319]|uniref:alpha/beta hydrolase n=1 Tax=Microvirga sp. TS319 TaxID=3241165 RepID=UPI003519E1D4
MVSSKTTALNADALEFLRKARESARLPFQEMAPEEARKLYESSCCMTAFSVTELAQTQDLSVATAQHAVPIRIYRPMRSAPGGSPAILYIHGGGWVLGSISTHDAICHMLATSVDAVVVAVDYRLAPDYPFPAGFNDVLAAYHFVCHNATELGIDPTRVALAGDSAGGALAASLALALRTEVDVPPIAQVLFYPVTDISTESQGYERVQDGSILTAQTMRWFRDHYAPRSLDRHDWRASPMKAQSLHGAAPALIITAAHDPLCEEGGAYAERLERDGVPTTHVHLEDQMHAFLTMGGIIPSARVPFDYAVQFLRQRLFPSE